MPHFKSINFFQNRPKINLFLLKKTEKSLRAEGSAPRPPKLPTPWQISSYVPIPMPLLREARGALTSLMVACAPPVPFTQNTFLEPHVTTR